MVTKPSIGLHWTVYTAKFTYELLDLCMVGKKKLQKPHHFKSYLQKEILRKQKGCSLDFELMQVQNKEKARKLRF